MKALWRIILWLLWRHRPAMAVETNLVDIIRIGFDFFANDEILFRLQQDKAFRAQSASSFLDAHRQLDLLIHLRALKIAGLTFHGPGFKPCRHPHHGERTPEDLWRRFRRLVDRFENVERCAHLRAAKLRREQNDAVPAALLAAAPFAPDHDDLPIITISNTSNKVLSPLVRDGSARRSAAKAAGGSHARGPPPKRFPGIKTNASQHPSARTRPHACCLPLAPFISRS